MNVDENHTSLKLSEFTCPPEELSLKLGLKPTKTATKGQIYYVGPKGNRIEKVWEYNYWEYRVTKRDDTWISDQFDEFLDNIIIPIKDTLKSVLLTCDGELSIVQYAYNSCNPSLHFDRDKIKIISDIGAHLDIDIYCLADD